MRTVCYYSLQSLIFLAHIKKKLKLKVQKAMIFYVVLYEFETLFLVLKEERRLRMFVKKTVRSIEVTTNWRKLLNEEFYNL